MDALALLAEARKAGLTVTALLATLDPLAGLAEPDPEALEALLGIVDSGNAALAQLLADLATDSGITPPMFEPSGLDGQGRLDQKKPVTCPKCGHEFTP